MRKHRVSAIPVKRVATSLDETLEQANEPVDSPELFLGFVDTLDVTCFLVEQYAIHRRAHPNQPHVYDPNEMKKAFETPCSVLVNESTRDGFFAVDENVSLREAIDTFFRHGVHRVAVTVEQSVRGIVSQSDVLRFLNDRVKESGIGEQSLLDLELVALKHARAHELAEAEAASNNERKSTVRTQVLSVKTTTPVIEALRMLIDNKVSGLAVMDNTKLVGCLSSSDVTFFSATKFFELELPLRDVMVFNEGDDGERAPVTVTEHATLGALLATVVREKVHRVFVVDQVTKRPVQCCSLSDILYAIFHLIKEV